jgi:hypothetical protein
MKTEIPIFTENYTSHLFRSLIVKDQINLYLGDKFPFEEKFPRGSSGVFLDPKFQLSNDKSDFENSKALYENLELNETQASDKRLWTYLTHVRFWEYMKKRWPLKEDKELFGRLKDRYFLNNINIESLSRNGISRLWWYSYLTIDKSRKDHYELTKILLNRQEIAVGILERRLGSINSVRRGILDFLKDNPKIMNNEDRTRELIKYVNLTGGVKVLSVLKYGEVRKILDRFPSE